MLKVPNYEFIECVVALNSTVTKNYFPDQPQLRFKNLLGLSCYSSKSVENSVISGNQVANNAALIQSTLVLYANDREVVDRMPLTDLVAQYTGFVASNIERSIFNGQRIVWSKSYILTATPYDFTGYTTPMSFVFGVTWS
jgi:hypothetical protein